MAEYISTFTTGFSEVISKSLVKLLPGAKVLKVYDGLVDYMYNGSEENVKNIVIFNNSYLVIKKFQGKNSEMTSMVKNIITFDKLPKSQKTFRIRYSQNNQFVGINKTYTQQIERKISKLTSAKIDRVCPETEYWFIKRSENVGFFGRLLQKRKFTEKNLNKGELRPELSYLMCILGEFKKSTVVMDPFAGYGAIPKQVNKYFHFKQLYVSDINPEHIKFLNILFENKHNVNVTLRNALNMQDIEDNMIDLIITDPPWGYYEKIDNIEQFYIDMFKEFCRVIKKNGKLVILSARKDEFELVLSKQKYIISEKIDTLINGKKASIYVINM